MQIEYHLRGIADHVGLRRQVQNALSGLHKILSITRADIVLECQREATPPYQAMATLAVSGPDLHAAARDHTWPAAWQKVVLRLRGQMEARRHRPAARPGAASCIARPSGRRLKRHEPLA